MADNEETILLAIEAVDRTTEVLDKADLNIKSLGETAKEVSKQVDESSTKIDESLTGIGKSSEKASEDVAKGSKKATEETDAMAEKFNNSTSKIGGIFGQLGSSMGNWGLPFGESVSKMGEKISDAETKSGKFSQILQATGKVAMVAGVAGFAVAAGEGVKLAMSYQTATTTLANSSGVSIKAAQSIGTAFLNTAGTTQASAQEMMTAYSAVGGELKDIYGHALSTSDAMTIMNASTNLADATGQSLTATTKGIADTLGVYHLKVSNAAQVSDMFYNTAAAMGTSVSAVSTAFDRLEPRLVGSGLSMGQTAGLMDEISKTAGHGRQALRIVGTAVQQLESPSVAAQKSLDKLGISLVDASGKSIGVSASLDKLKGVMNSNIPASEKAALMNQLFGKQAAMMTPLIEGGSAALDKATSKMTAQGTAANAAKSQAQTFSGQIKILKATGEDLATKLGQVLIPIIVKLSSVLAKSINWLENHKQIAIALAAVIGTVLAVAIGVKLVGAFKNVMGAMSAMKGVVKGVMAVFDTNPWMIAILAIIVVVILLITHWKDVEKVAKAVWKKIDGVIKDVWNWIKANWPLLLAILTGPIGLFVLFVIKNWKTIKDDTLAFINDIVNFFSSLPGKIIAFLEKLVLWWINLHVVILKLLINLASSILSWASGVATSAIGQLVKLVSWFIALPGKIISSIANLASQFSKAADNWVMSILKAFEGIGGKIMSKITHGITSIGSSALSAVGLAKGGLVTQPTLAVIGEAGPEVVVPMSNLQAGLGNVQGLPSVQPALSNSSSSTTSVYVDMRNSTALSSGAMKEFANKVGQVITQQLPNRGAVIRM